VRKAGCGERRLGIPGVGDGSGAHRKGRQAVGEEEHDRARAGPRRALGTGESSELTNGEPDTGGEVGGAVRSTCQDRLHRRAHPTMVRGERHLEPRVLLVPAHALTGVGVHLAREADHADADALGIERLDQRDRRSRLGRQDGVARIRRLEIRRIATGLDQLELRIEAQDAVAIHVASTSLPLAIWVEPETSRTIITSKSAGRSPCAMALPRIGA
jgi:hypothetical protein